MAENLRITQALTESEGRLREALQHRWLCHSGQPDVATRGPVFATQSARAGGDAGLTHVVLESTSHGLAQHRVTACEFDVAVVTNITHEHLDYHGTYEAYRAAKARLFTGLEKTRAKKHGNPRLAVLNRGGTLLLLPSVKLTEPAINGGGMEMFRPAK